MVRHPTAKKIIATVLSFTLLSTSVYAAPAPQDEPAQRVSYSELVGGNVGKAELIQVEIKNYRVLVDSGVMAPHEAVGLFAKNLVDHNVGFQDIDAYIKLRTTRPEYKKFKFTFESALSGVNEKTLTPRDMTALLSNAMESQDISGLSWSGCAGMATGIVLLVGAVVVGIVALCRTSASCMGINLVSDQTNIVTRQQKYQTDLATVKGQQAAYTTQIGTNQAQIASNTVQIAALQSEINNDPHSDPSYAANITAWSTQMANLQSQNTTLTGSNLTLAAQFSNWNESAQESGITSQYNSDMSALQGALANNTANLNGKTSSAPTLGLIAGTALAAGLYLTIDGANDKGCN